MVKGGLLKSKLSILKKFFTTVLLITGAVFTSCAIIDVNAEIYISSFLADNLKATIQDGLLTVALDKVDDKIRNIDYELSPNTTLTKMDGTSLQPEDIVVGEELPFILTSTNGQIQKRYSLLVTADIYISQKYSNGSYLWFDLVLADDVVVNFYAVDEGVTLPGAVLVQALADTDGGTLQDGRHFRDQHKAGELHRVVLYNLDLSQSYDIGVYFSGGFYPDHHETILTTMETAGAFTPSGTPRYPAFPGQRVLFPSTQTGTLGDILLSESYSWYNKSSNNALFTVTGGGSIANGPGYDGGIHSGMTLFLDGDQRVFLSLDSVIPSQEERYYTALTDPGRDQSQYIDFDVIN